VWNPSTVPWSLSSSDDFGSDHGMLNFQHSLQNPVTISIDDADNEYLVHIRPQQTLRSKDLKLDLHDRVLTVSGERRKDKHRGNTDEVRYVSFSRSMTLPKEAKLDGIKAQMKDNGEICICVPKIEGSSKHRQILIEGYNNKGTQNIEQKDKFIKNDNLETGQHLNQTPGKDVPSYNKEQQYQGLGDYEKTKQGILNTDTLMETQERRNVRKV